MSDNVNKDPLSLFSVKGKTAIVTGATGAFGAMAAKVFAAAGANVVVTANGAEALKKIAAECEKIGGKAEIVAKRPSSEANCDAIVEAAEKRFGSVDILAVGSGQNKVSKIVDQKPEDFLDVMDANVTQSWLMSRAAARAKMIKQGQEGKPGGKIILMSSARGLARPSGRLHRLLRVEVGGRRYHQGARLRKPGATGITVNALGPTVFRSPLTEWMFADDERGKNGVRARLPDTRVPKEPARRARGSGGAALVPRLRRRPDFYTGHTTSTPTAAITAG